MKPHAILAAAAASFLSVSAAFALTETVNGIEWTYTVSSGKASVGSGDYDGARAVPMSTTGGITIPSTLGGYPVTRIWDCAFRDCSGLTSVTIPDSVTSIGEYAFCDCSGLTSVTIPHSVTSIENWAFRNCSGLTSVTIPDSVTSIGFSAFSCCSGLTTISVSANNTNFSSMNGLLLSKDGRELIQGVNGVVVIPDGVTSIGADAFCGYSGLTSVTIPDSVTSIGDDAFSGCSGLTSVTIPDGVTYIGDGSFSGCSSLTSVTIPNSVTSINRETFSGCSGLTSVTIGYGVTSIGEHAFDGCSGLMSLTIPDSVTSIGWAAFSGCSGLTSVTIGAGITSLGNLPRDVSAFIVSQNSSVYSSVDGVLFSKDWKTLVWFPTKKSGSYSIPDDVTSIGSSAFANCRKLTSVTIPASVTSIGAGAFSGCSGLTAVHISDLATWCGIDFGDWSNPLECAHHLFLNGSEVTDLVVPDIVTRIGYAAFRKCNGLASVTIPDHVAEIAGFAFSDCTNLVSVTIGNGVTSIGYEAFSDCSGLTSVTIPDSVTSIGGWAFSGCSGLTSITIGAGITSLDNLPEDVSAFVVSPYSSTYSSADGVLFSKDGTTLVQFPTKKSGSYSIPVGVTNIREYAFSGCSGLTSVTTPDSVTSIGAGAFFGCSGLTSVTIPVSVTSIGNEAFFGCSGLTSVTIPDSVTSIGDDAFSGCSGLTAVYISDLAAWCRISFGYDANPLSSAHHLFLNNVEVTELIIPDSVTSIRYSAFSGCNGLTSVTIPSGVTSIWGSAFSGCSGLTSITIPATVTSIGAGAFNGCDDVRDTHTIPGAVLVDGWVVETSDSFSGILDLVRIRGLADSALSSCSEDSMIIVPARFAGQGSIPDGCTVVYCDGHLAVHSPYGLPTLPGVQGYCESGVPYEVAVEDAVLDGDTPGIRYVCTGWAGTGSVPSSGTGTNVTFTIEEDSSLTWLWSTNVWLSFSVEGDATAVGMTSGWFAKDGTAVFPFAPQGRHFTYTLLGDAEGAVLDESAWTVSIPADRPRAAALSVHVIGPDEVAATGTSAEAWSGVSSGLAAAGGWHLVEDASRSDGFCLRSDEVAAGETAEISLSLPVAGSLSFDWKISSNRGHNARFYVDDAVQRTITRSTDWATVELALGDGPHTLRWTYEKGSGATAGEDAAFLDDVRWTPLTLEGALDAPGLVWTTTGGATWFAQFADTSDGVSAARSGALVGQETSRLSTTLTGPGTLSWEWMAQIADVAGVDVWIGDNWVEDVYLDASTDWTAASLVLEGDGEHVVTFEFWNSGTTAGAIDDFVCIDCVAWSGATSGGDEPVVSPDEPPASWLAERAPTILAGCGGNAALAVEAMASNGVNTVRQCYIAGLDPESATARFEARIDMVDGEPVVSWSPVLPAAEAAKRVYTVDGKASLDDAWGEVGPDSQFFRVRVSMVGGGTQYEIVFDTLGGSEVAPVVASAGTAVAAPEDPTRAGYSFAGWQPAMPATMPEGGAALTARWDVRRATVSFDPAGGSAVAPVAAYPGTPLPAAKTSVRNGYDFDGWNPPMPAVMPEEDMTLTAQWTGLPFTLWFYSNGGTDVEPITQICGLAITPPDDPTREGYDFAGWQPAVPETMPPDGGTCRAQWTPHSYTVRFAANGGEGTMADVTFNYGEWKQLPANAFTRFEHTLRGWATAANGTVDYYDRDWVGNLAADDGAMVTLYAVWSINQYTVTFDSVGGSAVAAITRDYGAAITRPADPTRSGYDFAGWQPAIPATMPASNMTCRAQWAPHTYSVSFDVNGGTGEMQSLAFAYGESTNLPVNAFSWANHLFAGWATESDGEVAYANGSIVSNLTATANGSVTLYARWLASESADVAWFSEHGRTFPTATMGTWTVPEGDESLADETALAVDVPNGEALLYIPDETEPEGRKTTLRATIQFENVNSLYTLPDTSVWEPIGSITVVDPEDGNGPAYFIHVPGEGWVQLAGATPDTSRLVTVEAEIRFQNETSVMSFRVDGLILHAAADATRTAFPVSGEQRRIREIGIAGTGHLGAFRGAYCKAGLDPETAVLVRFDANGGLGEAEEQVITLGETETLAKPSYSKEGFVIAGWATTPDGPIILAPEATVCFTAPSGGVVTLYAVWTSFQR